jgi:hypothetical protein
LCVAGFLVRWIFCWFEVRAQIIVVRSQKSKVREQFIRVRAEIMKDRAQLFENREQISISISKLEFTTAHFLKNNLQKLKMTIINGFVEHAHFK